MSTSHFSLELMILRETVGLFGVGMWSRSLFLLLAWLGSQVTVKVGHMSWQR